MSVNSVSTQSQLYLQWQQQQMAQQASDQQASALAPASPQSAGATNQASQTQGAQQQLQAQSQGTQAQHMGHHGHRRGEPQASATSTDTASAVQPANSVSGSSSLVDILA